MTSDKRSRVTEVILVPLHRMLQFEALTVGDRAAIDQLIAEANEESLRYPPPTSPLQWREYGARLALLLSRAKSLAAKYANAS